MRRVSTNTHTHTHTQLVHTVVDQGGVPQFDECPELWSSQLPHSTLTRISMGGHMNEHPFQSDRCSYATTEHALTRAHLSLY